MVKIKSVKYKIVEKEEEIIEGVNIGVFGGIKGIEKAMINSISRCISSIIKDLTKLELLVL